MSDRKRRPARERCKRRRSCTGGANLVRLPQPIHSPIQWSEDRPLPRLAKVAVLTVALLMALIFLAAAFATATGLIPPASHGAPLDRTVSTSELITG